MIIAISNQKGGVGKTTTAVTLAHGFALRDYSVLLVDLDSQGNVADSLGMDPGADLSRLLFPGAGDVQLDAVATMSGRPGLDVIRSDKTTVQLKAALAGDGLSGFRLQMALSQVPHDLVLIDCAPSVDLLHTAALVAADWLIIPTRLDQLAIKGVRDALQSLVSVNKVSQHPCHLLGILPTFYDRVTNESQAQLTHLVQTFGKAVLPPVPIDTVCRRATRFGKTLFEYAEQTRALIGLTNGKGNVGGYNQVLDHIQERLA